jgi:serine protease
VWASQICHKQDRHNDCGYDRNMTQARASRLLFATVFVATSAFATEGTPGGADGWVFDFADDLSPAHIEAVLQRVGVTLDDTTEMADGNLYRFRGDEAAARSLGAALEDELSIEGMEPNAYYGLLDWLGGQPLEAGLPLVGAGIDVQDAPSPAKPTPVKPNDPMYASQWHFDMVHAEAAWSRTKGDGVVVAVIDTGVSMGTLENGKKSKYKRVPDLKETVIVAGFNFVDNSNDASDGNGHGTHVAGTIAQSTNNEFGVAGLAPGARIMPIKVLSDQGSGTVADIANGIRFAADKGAKVINMSLGGGMYSSTLARAVKYAHDKGVFVACAAGNGGRQKVEYPASYDGCVAVSALGPDGKLAFYSSYGKELDIAAPGGDTRVDLNKDGLPDGVLQDTIARGDPNAHGFFPYQGTSMATPHVAAAAALVFAQGVSDPDRVEKVLKSSATTLNDAIRYGAGGLDVGAATRKANQDEPLGGLALGGLMAAWAVSRTRRREGSLSQASWSPLMVIGLMAGAGVVLPWAVSLGLWSATIASWTALLVAPAMMLVFGLGFGVRSARPLLAGLGFGVAGFLAVRAVLGSVDVAVIPGHSLMDAAWLTVGACVVAGVSMLAIKRD